jgi:glycerol-3-phosphate acyltransferase PlsY
MPTAGVIAVYVLLAYLVGSINLAILLTRAFHLQDPRGAGSSNPGVTNLYRTAGIKVAGPVLMLDLGKAFLVIHGAGLVGLLELAPFFALPYVLGNLFPLFHGFRGGKGVAAVVGTFLAIDPVVMLAGGGVFILMLVLTRRVSVGSMAMVLSYPAWIIALGGALSSLITAAILGVVLLATHRANLARLLRGKEPKLMRRQ